MENVFRSNPAELIRPPQDSILWLEFYCLGKFRAVLNGRPITRWDSLKGLAVLKFLIAHPGKAITRDVLMDQFWPEAAPERARQSLHQAVYSLRKSFHRSNVRLRPVQIENGSYSLDRELAIESDIEKFERKVRTARCLAAEGREDEAAFILKQAEDLYTGDFLEDDLYEEWTGSHREIYRGHYLDLLTRLSEYHRLRGENEFAIDLCRKLLARDSCNEDAHRRLMQCLQHQGQRARAVRQYHICADALKKEIGVVPARETQALFELISGS